MYRTALAVVSILFTSSLEVSGLTLDLKKGSPDIQIVSGTSGIWFKSVTAGDCNGDGFDDVILRGAPHRILSVIFGRNTFPKVIQFSEANVPDLVITNISPTSIGSSQVSVGDINGDDVGDLLVVVEEGLEVFWGRKKWPARLDMQSHHADLQIIGKRSWPSGGFTTALATTGDINKDGIPDLLFAFADSPPKLGNVLEGDLPQQEEWTVGTREVAWIFWGRKSWPTVLDLNKQKADVVITAEHSNQTAHRLRPFKIADLDGDGFGDILAGAWDDVQGTLNPPVGAPWSRAWVIQGRADLPSHLKLALQPKSMGDSNTGKPMEPLVIDAWPHGKFIGGGIAVGDVTGDGRGDLVLRVLKKGKGAWDISKELCFLEGRSNFFAAESRDLFTRCSRFVGEESFQIAGRAFSPRALLGDFNGDGHKDLFMVLEAPDFVFAGLLGQQTFPGTVHFNAGAQIRIQTPLAVIERPGYLHSSAIGDINGDGKADLLIGDALRGVGSRENMGNGGVEIVLGRDLKATSAQGVDSLTED